MPIIKTEETGPCSKTLTIEVPVDKIKEEVDGIYEELKEHALVPGFRPGKATLPVLKMRFGRHVEGESRLKAVESAWQKAAEELGVAIAGEPNVHDVEGEGDEPIRFQVDIQHYPDVQLGEYKGVAVKAEKQETTDKQVEDSLKSMQERMAYLAPVEGRPAAEGDVVTVDSSAVVEGEDVPEAKAEGYQFRIGSKGHLPGFEEAVIGKNIDETAEVEITLPEDFFVEQHQGKTAHFTLQVVNISERKLPELDDEFAKDLNAESLEELRNRIRKDLEDQAKNREPRAIQEAYETYLLENHQFDVPPVLVEGEEAYISSMHETQLARMGINFASLTDEQQERAKAVNREVAEKNVRLSILLRKIADVEEMDVDDEELEDHIEQTAERQGEDPGKFRIFVDTRGLEPYFRREALEKKVMDEMLKTLNVEWKPASEESEG